MGGIWGRVLWLFFIQLALLSSLLGGVGVVTGFETTLEFDSLPPGTGIEDQYESRGVIFEPPTNTTPGAVLEECTANSTFCSSARSGEQVIRPPYVFSPLAVAAFSGYSPIVVRFTDTTRRVSLHISEYDSVSGSYTGQMAAYDSAGEEIAVDSLSFASDTGYHPLQIELDSDDISAVQITLRSANGSTTNEFVADDLEFGINEPPVADFRYSPQPAETGSPTTFDASDSTDSDGDITTYSWDFDNDGNIDRNTSSSLTTYSYSTPGSHQIRLRVIDDDGAEDLVEDDIYVNAPPRATFDYSPFDPTVGQTIDFDASESTDRNGGIRRYEWDFESDGDVDKVSFQPRVVHEYTESDRYIASLTVTDNDGSTDVHRLPISVSPSEDEGAGAPEAIFNISPQQPTANQPVVFDASGSSSPNGRIELYRWNFNDGSDNETTDSPVIEHTFTQRGTYSVKLAISDEAGRIDTVKSAISVTDSGLDEKIYIDYRPRPVAIGQSVRFSVSGQNLPPNGSAIYHWDLNDDDTFDRQTSVPKTRFVFDDPGEYRSRVIIESDGGRLEAEVDPPISVGIPPNPLIRYQPQRVIAGEEITLDGSASTDPDGEITEYHWDFDNDGRTDSTGAQIPHTFETDGTESVTLEVEDNDGHRAKVTRSIIVSEASSPTISIGLLGTTSVLSLIFTILAISSGSTAGFSSVFLRPERPTPDNEPANQESNNRNRETEESTVIVDSVSVRDYDSEDLNEEYIVLKNQSDQSYQLGGATIADDDGNIFTFPVGYELDPNQSVRIHTGHGESSSSKLYWGMDRSVWDQDIDWVIVRGPYNELLDVVYYE